MYFTFWKENEIKYVEKYGKTLCKHILWVRETRNGDRERGLLTVLLLALRPLKMAGAGGRKGNRKCKLQEDQAKGCEVHSLMLQEWKRKGYAEYRYPLSEVQTLSFEWSTLAKTFIILHTLFLIKGHIKNDLTLESIAMILSNLLGWDLMFE